MGVYMEYGPKGKTETSLVSSFSRATGFFGGARAGVDVYVAPGTRGHGTVKTVHLDVGYDKFRALFSEAQSSRTTLDMTDETLEAHTGMSLG